ncbi:helix-turn-helix domain-containing protein [Pseudoduganella albidiflava]|nr:hypothetical protein [Pseudoduganella albidiflava]
MKATFIELPSFQRLRAEYFDDDAFRALQSELMKNPEAGDVIKGTGGLRKIRYADERRGKGKRGGLRVISAGHLFLEGRRGPVLVIYRLRQGRGTRPHPGSMQDAEAATGVGNQGKESPTMTKRDIFADLMEGFDALEQAREGKLTLRTSEVEYRPAPEMTPENVRALRKKLHVSQPVFARKLRTEVRTIKNWEQGISKPNDQAAILLKLIDLNPAILDQIAIL